MGTRAQSAGESPLRAERSGSVLIEFPSVVSDADEALPEGVDDPAMCTTC